MSRTPLWTSIAATLRHEIARGHYLPGERLPTEAALSGRFGVNRHTVRHALAQLAEEGLVHARRGSGVFVQRRPTAYPLGRRVRFHEVIEAAGQTAEKRITRIETRAADRAERAALKLPREAQVIVREGVALVDDAPMAMFQAVYPAELSPVLADALREHPSVTRALAACGIADYTRAGTQLSAVAATATQALALHLREGAPLLLSVGLNVDGAGRPLEWGHTWFVGERAVLTIGADRDD